MVDSGVCDALSASVDTLRGDAGVACPATIVEYHTCADRGRREHLMRPNVAVGSEVPPTFSVWLFGSASVKWSIANYANGFVICGHASAEAVRAESAWSPSGIAPDATTTCAREQPMSAAARAGRALATCNARSARCWERGMGRRLHRR